jgi:hypothetical protein
MWQQLLPYQTTYSYKSVGFIYKLILICLFLDDTLLLYLPVVI